MMIHGITGKRWPAYLILLAALLVVLLAWSARGENLLTTAAVCAAILWCTQLPGSLALLLFEGRVGGRLRFLLAGQALGLALLPLLYILLLALDIHGHYLTVQSAINLLLAAAVALRGKSGELRRLGDAISSPTLLALGIVVLAVVLSVAVRELLLFHPGHLLVSSAQEVDAGYLMGLVNGIRRTGSLIDVNGGGLPMHYHYFTYLIMALVGEASGAEDLTIYQAVFPLYFFLLLALSTYSLTRLISRSRRAALLAALLILFLNDLSIVNNLVAAATGSEAYTIFYATLNIAYLHGSPSWLVSVALVMILLGEIARIQRAGGSLEGGTVGIRSFLPFILIISVLAGYKVPAWMCLVGGMGLASLLLARRRPVYLAASILSGIGGALVLLFCVGISTGQSALGSMYVGYPVLRNDAVQRLTGIGGHTFSLGELTPWIALLIVVLIPFWLAVTYGVRIVWLVRAVRRFGTFFREENLAELTALLSVAVGLAIALLMAPERSPLIVYYNSIFGLLVSTPFAAVLLNEYLGRWRGIPRLALAGLIVVQMSSGFLYLAKPLLQKKHIADLGGDWLDAMTFLRNETPPDAVLLSNRYGFSTDPGLSTYNEQFYFVPAFSHRTVAVSGSRYYLETGEQYARMRRLADTLFTTSLAPRVAALADSLGVDYIVFDRWAGDSLRSSDPVLLQKVYSNPQIDIYRIRPDSTGEPVRHDSTFSRQR